MNKNALEPLRMRRVAQSGKVRASWMLSFGVTLFVGALFAQFGWAQTVSTRGFQRVPISAAFEPKFMPFQGISPLANYGAMGNAPWVTLQYVGRPAGKEFLHVASLRLYPSAPSEATKVASIAAPNQDRERRIYSAQDVRALWTNRGVLTAWLDFDSATDALHQRLKERGSLPVEARVQALTQEIYAEVPAVAEASAKLVLKKQSGQIITPEVPAPTWVEPLFHQVFLACVAAERPSQFPLSKQVLGNRYDTDRLCGLMSDEGRWLARPEYELMESVHGSGRYMGEGPFLLMLRGNEPCIANLNMPVQVACLGQPLSSLFGSGRLPFSSVNLINRRRGGDAIGYVAADGAWAIPPKFREAQAFSGKVATVQLAGVLGLIDASGKWLTPAVPSDPVASRWLVQRGMSQMSGSGLINRSGQMVIPFLFPKVEPVDATSYRVCHQNGCDTIQVPKASAAPQARPIAANVAAQAVQSAASWVPAGVNGLWGYQEASGRWVLKPSFEDAEPFEGGLAKAKSEGQWGVILPTGKWLYPPKFQSISLFSNGVAVAQDANGKHTLLRADGKHIEITEGRALSLFGTDGLAVVGEPSGNNVGYIDRNGEWIIKPGYSQAQPFSGGYAIVSGKLPESWRPANFNEPPYILRSVHWLSTDVLALRALIGKEERVGLMDKEGNWLVPAH